MSSKQKILIFIPSYNDNVMAKAVAKKINQSFKNFDVLVIDDGSVDDIKTEQIADCFFFRMDTNYGLGVCTNIAIDFMLQNNYSILVRVDGDGQHPIEEIENLIAPLLSNDADFTVGSRINHQKGSNNFIRNAVKKYYNFVAKKMTRNNAPSDVNSGFFAINKGAANELNQLMLERYPEPETYIHLSKNGFRLMNIEINQIKRKMKTSSLNMFNGIRMFYKFNIFILSELIDQIKK